MFYLYNWNGCEFWRSSNQPIQINKNHFISFDLESSLNYNGKRIKSNEEYEQLCKSIKKLTQEEKDKFETFAWCFLCYDDYNGFCCFKTWDDFFKYVVFTESYLIWDFNLKFDGSFLDYIFYFNPNYIDSNKARALNKVYYSNLVGSNGQRYQLKLQHNKKSYFINDFNNIIKSSIKQLAIDFNIKLNNEQVTKRTMDYFSVSWDNINDDVLNYCFNDVYILYNTIIKFNKEMNEFAPFYSLIDYKKSVPLTSGGLSKGVLLKYIYGENNFKSNRLMYWNAHFNTILMDQQYRNNGLYKGGLTFINQYYKGKQLNNINIYDVNSEYPYIMSQLCDLIHRPFIFSYDKFLEDKLKANKVYIFFFSELEMKIKKNMVPCFFYRGENEPYFKFIKTFNDKYITLFEDEFNNLKQFYEIINYKIDLVHGYLKGDKVYKPFVDHFYKIKQTTKNKTRKNLTKLILNSSYGKLGQKIRLPQIEQYLKGRVVTFRKKRDKNNFIIYEDILKNKMSVVNAAYITCSARCFIRNKILELSNGNMLKNFIYCDTDSIHTFNNYKNVNDELGGLKLEYSGQRGRYLKPKTYILEKDKKFKISAKGINKNYLFNQLCENFEGFNYESYFYSLSSVLVKGGRALILINKNLGVRE